MGSVADCVVVTMGSFSDVVLLTVVVVEVVISVPFLTFSQHC